uniref:Peptidase S1 domain-containing protein n=1 Tax=Trichuris muris TaxID=70415 RepID=A0A5S6R4E5_TRIMR
MDTGLPGKYSYYGDNDRRNKAIKEVPSVLEHHRQGHPVMAPPSDPRSQKMRNLYKFGFIALICAIFVLVIVLSSILSTDGSSSNVDAAGSTMDKRRKFSCYFACDNRNHQAEPLPAERTPPLELAYNKKIREAFQNTTLQPYLEAIEFLGIDESDDHSVAEIKAILTFINGSKGAEQLNEDFIADALRNNVDCARKETVKVIELEEPITPTTQEPTTEPSMSTSGTTSSEVTPIPPSKNYSVHPLLPFCNGHGWSETCYPNYLGYKTPEEALASLSFFQIITQQECHPHIRYFSCMLLQPPCSETNGRVPICKPFCEGVKDSCWESLRFTEIGRMDLCGIENANYGPKCSQICSPSDFVCEKTKMCISEKRRCNARLDCGPGDLSDELNCTCKSNQFRCANGMCIKQSLQCNNVNDCGEWEDEIGCQCREGWKSCSRTGQCFPLSAWCDQKFDCDDHSDETECLCAPNEYKCQNGLCRPSSDRCNGINDCGDFSDEFDCTCSADQFLCDKHLCKYYAKDWCNGKADCVDKTDEPDECQCKPGQYKCDDGTCIPEHRACDRSIDCPDGSDERHCKCDSLEFECEPGHCIPLEQVCDGVEQCSNKADELQNCECPVSTHFRCNSGQCLPLTRYCNFVKDCPDGEDEGTGCTTTCPAGYAFKCILRRTTEYTCLPADKVCDGIPDCDRNEDETNCGGCKRNQFRCDDGTCVPWAAYCNGIHDCVDTSDEKNCTCNPTLQFSCDDGWCYMKEQRCDGVAQCADMSDETQCTCAELLYKQHPDRICDQVADCQDLSDEQDCDSMHSTPATFLCYAGRVIDVNKVCDGKKDCPLGDDERHCAILAGDASEDLKRYWEFRDAGTVYFRRNGVWAPVCALENSTEVLIATAQYVCAQNLYQTVADIATVDWNRTEPMYKPLSNYSSAHTLAPPGKECNSGQALYIKCSQQTCGDNPYNLGDKGNAALLGSSANTLPFFVSIYSDRTHRCAGNLLGKIWVLTTASCLDTTNEKTLTVRVSLQRNSSLSPYDQFSPVSHQLKHSMYGGHPGKANDIALLRLAVPLKSTPMAQPLCLGLWDYDNSSDDRTAESKETSLTFTLGMGRLRRKKISVEHPDMAELTITNTSSCRQNRIVRLKGLNIRNDQFCAFEQPENYRCQGELGSPIMKKQPNSKWHLIGLTSTPHSCTNRKYPSIYLNVTHYIKWIEHAAEVLHAQRPNIRICENGMFACLLGDCIDASAVCDGIRNCAFGEDEKKC